MKTFKKSMAIILSILMLFSVMTVAGISASAAEETVAIYFVNSGNWDTVNAYAWASGGSGQWPGVAMTALNEKAANGGDIYVYEYVDAGEDRVIFNNGTDQTGNLILKQGLYYDYLSDSWYTDPTLSEEVTDPTVDPSQIKYYVAGEAGLCGEAWNPKGEAAVMTDNGDGTYTKVFTGIAAGTYNFKITDGTWDNSWGAEGGKNNIEITVAEDNTDVTITFDLNTKLTTVSMAAGATPSETESQETPSETESQETPSETESQETPSETESQETPSETESQETPSETESQETTASETESQETTASETESQETSSETTPAESTEAPTLPAEGTFHVVAGAPELCNGANWDPASALNLMTLGEDDVYSITYTNVPAGTYDFKVTTNGKWDVADFNLVGDAKFGGPNAQITVTEDNSTVVVSFKESDMHANAYINGVLVDMGATEPTKPTETEPKPTETEPTQPTEPACDHSNTTTTGKKAATYFTKGNTGDTVCADCGEVIAKGRATAVKKLNTPKVTVKTAKKAIKVTYKNVKDAKGFKVTYKLGKKTFNKKYTLSKKELKKSKVTKTIKVSKAGKYKVTVKAFVTSAKKTAYSDPTKAATAKVK